MASLKDIRERNEDINRKIQHIVELYKLQGKTISNEDGILKFGERIDKYLKQLGYYDDNIQAVDEEKDEQKLNLALKYQETEVDLLDKIILENELPKKIDSEFIKKYYGAVNQAKLALGGLSDFEDVLLMNGLAGLDCEALGLDFSSLSQEEFECLPFDSKTNFSTETIEQFHPDQILEKGKDFGLGLSKIGLTGKGVHIAIRDQNCNPYLTDANIAEYTNTEYGNTRHEVNADDIEYMHGMTTTSLLASKSCGVAKDSSVHFFSSSMLIKEYVENIVAHNQRCQEEGREDDMILVASGSWGDKNFAIHQKILRAAGCELVCANNFNENFGEFVNNGGIIQNPLDMPQEEIDKFIEDFPKREEQIRVVTDNDKVKIPISRTYHQIGCKEGEDPIFKYQSSFSTSWGVPQVAGLLAVFKQMDRTLTFDEFLSYARDTAQGEMKIINPEGILEKARENLHEKISMFHDQKSEFLFEMLKSGVHTIPQQGKSGFDDCIQDSGLRTSTAQEATQAVKEEVIGNRVIDENTQQK